MVIKNTQVKKILKDPSKAAEVANLIYVSEEKLSIKRHRHGRGFYYTENEKKIEDAKALQRFKNLIIPPAWNDVLIAPIPNSHLQVVGKDDKNRKQYKYHPRWNQIRNETKFFKMASFGQALPQIRKQVKLDLQIPNMTRRKCLALIVGLMEETHIRIGNGFYAKNNQTYGLSTLRNKHLMVNGNEMIFHFIGKKGKKHSISLQNKKLQKLVLKCKEIPGWELFQYYDENGEHHSIDSGMVNEYIQEISGDHFSAKDFRTWAGSKIFFETLSELEKPDSATAMKKNLLEAYEAVADRLGNTRTVCKKYYVHPALPCKYENGEMEKSFERVKKSKYTDPWLSSSELELLEIISDYKIQLD